MMRPAMMVRGVLVVGPTPHETETAARRISDEESDMSRGFVNRRGVFLTPREALEQLRRLGFSVIRKTFGEEVVVPTGGVLKVGDVVTVTI